MNTEQTEDQLQLQLDQAEQAKNAQTLTEGQKLVKLESHPTDLNGTNEFVYDTKIQYAKIIDMLLRRRNEVGNSYLKNLLIGTALSAVLTACWATVAVIVWVD